MQAFDELLLLKRGGRTIYCGPTGFESQQLVAYFQGHNGVSPLPEGTNPASWMLDVSFFHSVSASRMELRLRSSRAQTLVLLLSCLESSDRMYRCVERAWRLSLRAPSLLSASFFPSVQTAPACSCEIWLCYRIRLSAGICSRSSGVLSSRGDVQ